MKMEVKCEFVKNCQRWVHYTGTVFLEGFFNGNLHKWQSLPCGTDIGGPLSMPNLPGHHLSPLTSTLCQRGLRGPRERLLWKNQNFFIIFQERMRIAGSLPCGSPHTIKGKQRLSLSVTQKEIEYQIDVEYDIKKKFAFFLQLYEKLTCFHIQETCVCKCVWVSDVGEGP